MHLGKGDGGGADIGHVHRLWGKYFMLDTQAIYRSLLLLIIQFARYWRVSTPCELSYLYTEGDIII